MKSFSLIVNTLQKSRYLTGRQLENTIIDIELLSNGKQYGEQFTEHWRQYRTDDQHLITHFLPDAECESSHHKFDRLSFVFTSRFRKNLKDFLLSYKFDGHRPAVIKAIEFFGSESSGEQENVFLLDSKQGNTHLISDFLFHPNCALEKFHNIQRERKIWWMRISANPSRYLVDSFDLTKRFNDLSNAHSVTIKTRLPHCTLDIEHLTLIPLASVNLEANKNVQMQQGKGMPPTIIRSVINLELATCAMILDGCYHSRSDVLLLDRKMAPYQCRLACLHKNENLSDLHDLVEHISFMIRNSGLRLYDDHQIFTNCMNSLMIDFRMADSIGIPYIIVIEEEALQNGLLKLRSRDTTLQETIHISDLKEYLLNIFTTN